MPQPTGWLTQLILKLFSPLDQETDQSGRDYQAKARDLIGQAFARRADMAHLMAPDLATDLEKFREATTEILIDRLRRYLHRINQFSQPSPDQTARLEEIYGDLVESFIAVTATAESVDACAAELQQVMDGHFDRLEPVVQEIVGPAREGGPDRTVSNEYQALLQLDVFGIQSTDLTQPILDLGCGENGLLVEYLRDQGLQAFGLDPFAQEKDYLVRTDWFEFRFKPGMWGAIISHMAFSNHFVHHHLHPQGRFEDYAKLYMKILASLRPGGVFYYAPGLPFIEDLLPEEVFTVERRKVKEAREAAAADPALSKVLEEFGYAAVVTRSA